MTRSRTSRTVSDMESSPEFVGNLSSPTETFYGRPVSVLILLMPQEAANNGDQAGDKTDWGVKEDSSRSPADHEPNDHEDHNQHATADHAPVDTGRFFGSPPTFHSRP